jgi:hypothetical protein
LTAARGRELRQKMNENVVVCALAMSSLSLPCANNASGSAIGREVGAAITETLATYYFAGATARSVIGKDA